MTKIKLSETIKLANRLGEWVWDGVLYNRDGITDPTLTILPNRSGAAIRKHIKEVGLPKTYHFEDFEIEDYKARHEID